MKWSELIGKINKIKQKIDLEVDFKSSIYKITNAYSKDESWLKLRNTDFKAKEIQRFNEFFKNVEKQPLTKEQREAIVTDEVNNLIVAGAGTGKTSTIVGKTGYLIEKGLAKPEEILLLSFNRHVYKELQERIENRLKKKLQVYTYHSFGLQVIREATETTIDVSPLAEDRAKFSKKIHDFINNRMKDTAFAELINDYFLYYFVPYKSEFEFSSFREYVEFLKQIELRSLNGDKVKSFEECYIANFLFINGIEYSYEKPYKVKEFDLNHSHRQYRPDFYLPQHHLYIEHFGIDRNGKSAPFIPQSEYASQMKWKIDTHTRYNTQLIQTFSFEQNEGKLLTNLEIKLKEKGVVFKPLAKEQIFSELEKLGRINLFSRLIGNFLNLYKSSGKSISQITNEAKPDDARTRLFSKFSQPFLMITLHIYK